MHSLQYAPWHAQPTVRPVALFIAYSMPVACIAYSMPRGAIYSLHYARGAIYSLQYARGMHSLHA